MYRYSGWNPYASKEKTQETVEHYLREYHDPHFYSWVVCLDEKLIGTIGAYDYSAEDNSIVQKYWGRGYASETLKCVLTDLTQSISTI